MKIVVFIIALLALMIAVSTVFVVADTIDTASQCPPGSAACPEGGCAPDICPLLSPDLNLNIQQKEKVKAICAEHTRVIEAHKAMFAAEKTKLASILDASRPDKAAALVQIQKISRIKAKMQESDIETFIAAKALLTPAQAKTLSAEKFLAVNWKN